MAVKKNYNQARQAEKLDRRERARLAAEEVRREFFENHRNPSWEFDTAIPRIMRKFGLLK
jgi:hypothetical protein